MVIVCEDEVMKQPGLFLVCSILIVNNHGMMHTHIIDACLHTNMLH